MPILSSNRLKLGFYQLAATTIVNSQSLFTTQTPVSQSTDGGGSPDYELGMKFRVSVAGYITGIRYFKATNETGTYIGRIWRTSDTSQRAFVRFPQPATSSGWQSVNLDTPFPVAANTTYIVSSNINIYYPSTPGGLSSSITNNNISSVADGANGVFNETVATYPNSSFNNTNYFRDIIFIPATGVVSGSLQIYQSDYRYNVGSVISVYHEDINGLPAAGSISYQWQRSTDGSSWSNISGATSGTSYTLTSSDLLNHIRLTASYTDLNSNSQNITSNIIGKIYYGLYSTQTPNFTSDFIGSTPSVYELGQKFQSSSSGNVYGLRFYKHTLDNIYNRTCRLWDTAGTQLTSISSNTNEYGWGWQTILFSSPVAISANTVYTVSINVSGYYTTLSLASITNSPLSTGTNSGVFNTTPGSFPTTSVGSLYFIDPLFA